MGDKSFEVNLEECRIILKNYLQNEDFKIINYKQKSLAGKVMGIMAGHYMLEIKYKINDQTHTINFFEKRMKAIHSIQDRVIKEQGAYKKEDFMYNYFFKYLEKVPTYNSEYIPKCYYAKKDKFLVMQDLGQLGFKTNTNEDFTLSFEQCKHALSIVANFHAASIIFEDLQMKTTGKKYSLFDHFEEMFADPIYRKEDNFLGNNLYRTSINVILKLMDLSKVFDNNRDEIKKIYLQNVENVYELVKPAKDFRNVIVHGDLWSNNLLYKMDGEKVIDCRLIDFQALRYTVPSHDVLNLIYQASNINFRKEYVEVLLKYYHDELTNYLLANSIDVNEHVTYEDFKKSCDYVYPMILVQQSFFFLLMCLGTRPELFSNGDLFAKFMYEGDMKRDICIEEYKNNEFFRKIMDDTFGEFHKLKPVVK